jgi:hypothetical protein
MADASKLPPALRAFYRGFLRLRLQQSVANPTSSSVLPRNF